MGRINPILNSIRLLGSKLLLILAICCFPLVGFSQIGPIGTETQVNTSTAGSQQNPAIATNKSGDYVIVWESDGTDGSKYGIYGQLFNADGSLNGAEFLVNTYTSNDQRFPTVAMDGSGNFLISWMSYLQDGSGWGVYYRMYDNSGSAITGANRANASTTGDQRNPEAFCNDAGSFFITWSDISTDGTTYTIMGAPFNTSGSKVSADFQINSSTISSLAYSTGAMANDGSFMLVWQADGLDGSGMGVYARRYTNTNTPQANDFLVNTSTSGNQQAPDVAVDSAGNYAVVWEGYESGNSAYGIFAQNYDMSGLPQGSQYTINATVNDSKWPSVSMSTNGYYTVTWTTDNLDGSYAGVYAQSYELDGTPIGSSSLLNTSTTNFQQFSQIAHAIDDTLVIAWQDGLRSGAGTTDGDAYGVFSQRSKLILPLKLALDSVDNLCFGEALGSINSTVSGGVSPYTYAWSQGGSSASSINLLAGTYTLTVSDNVGSTIIDSIEVLQPASAIVASASVTGAIACNGDNNGQVTGSASGGTTPYTYSWNTGGTSAVENSLSAGNYYVTITDANGCTDSASVIVIEPQSLSIGFSVNNENCTDSDGSLTASPVGGTSPYTFNWSNLSSSNSISGLSYGKYTLTLTDNNGCSLIDSATVIRDYSNCQSSTNLRTLFIQDSSAQLRWDTVPDARLYKVVFKPKASLGWTQIIFRQHPFSIQNMSGLTPGTDYVWSIMVRYSDGSWSGLAPVAKFTTLAGPCLAPTSSSVGPIQSNSAKVSWSAMPSAQMYRLQYRAVGSSPWTTIPVSRNFVWISGLSPNTTYEYRLKTVCEIGPSSGTRWSGISNFTTDAIAPSSSIGDQYHKLEAIVYPNPTRGEFKLDIKSSDLSEKIIEIMDLRGEILYRSRTEILYGTTIDFNIIDLAKGVYIVRVQSAEEQVNTRLIVQ